MSKWGSSLCDLYVWLKSDISSFWGLNSLWRKYLVLVTVLAHTEASRNYALSSLLLAQPSFFYMQGQILDYYNEVLTHYTWKFIIGIRCNRHLLTSSPNNSFLIIICCPICSKFRKALPMANQPKISRNIHSQLQGTSCHPLTGKNHFNYHDMDYANLLLYHHQWHNLDKANVYCISHSSYLPYFVLQNIKITPSSFFLHFFIKISSKYFLESFQNSIFV